MSDQQDRIRVWNEETGEMIAPVTIQEMLRTESNNGNAEGYCHLVFMRNTGIYADTNMIHVNGAIEEIFDGDLITHSIEPWIYRVKYAQTHGCWWAESLCRDAVLGRQLSKIFHPTIVGNVFENRELFMKGEIIDE